MPAGLSLDQAPELDEAVLERIVDAYHSQTDGPRFRVLTSSYGFHIVPTKACDASGAWVDVRSALDSSIDLPVAGRTPEEHLIAFCRAVSESSGVVVKPFAPWLNQHFSPQESFIPKDREMTEKEKRAMSIPWGGRMPARDALISLLQLSDTTLTWHLRCSAEPSDYQCILNLAPIHVRVIKPGGSHREEVFHA